MNRKMLGGVLLALGLVLIVAGLVVMFVIVPSMKQFPDDVDITRTYEGTMPVLFDTQNFVFLTDLPIQLERHYETEEVDGDVALVVERQVMTSGSNELQSFTKRYAIDRDTFLFAEDYPEEWASKDGFWEREGVVLGWPLDPEKKDYTGWSDDYRGTVTLAFVDERKHEVADVDTYYYLAESPPALIDPEAVTAMKLPPALPKEQLLALAEQAGFPAPMLEALLEGVEGENVPLAYYYEYEGEYWVEQETGMLIDTKKHELRKVGLSDEVLSGSELTANMTEEQRAALRITVSDFTYQATEASVKEAADDAQEIKDSLQLYGTTLPIAAIVIGLVLGIAGAFLFMQKQAAA